MSFFRGPNDLKMEKELASILESVAKKDNKGNTFVDVLKQLMGPSFLKPYSCIGILYMIYNMAGLNTVSYYAEDFLDNVGEGIWKPSEAAVALAAFKFLMALLSPLILLKVPKKKLFVILSLISSSSFLAGKRKELCILSPSNIQFINQQLVCTTIFGLDSLTAAMLWPGVSLPSQWYHQSACPLASCQFYTS